MDLLVNTYKAYKARQSKVFDWIKQTSGQQDVTPNKIPSLARSIIKQGFTVPDNIVQLLQEVVSKRKEATACYRQRNVADVGAGHAHMVKILEDTLAVFRATKTKPAPYAAARKPLETKTEINNLYDMLQVDNLNVDRIYSPGQQASDGVVSESEDDVGANGSGKENPASKKTRVKKVKYGKRKGKPRKDTKTSGSKQALVSSKTDEYDWLAAGDDLEDDFDDVYFIIYCFFSDFNYIREYIQERWCDYQDGILSLSAVAITTNTAYELLEKGEQELLSLVPRDYRHYEAMSQMLFVEIGLAHVDYDAKDAEIHDKQEMDDSIFEEADFICLPRYWDLSEWLKNVPPKKMVVTPTLSALYDEPNKYGIDYHAKHSSEKMQRDRNILYELIAECTLVKAFHVNIETFQPPGEDQFTLGVIKMLANRRIPIWLVFASQIQCDIRYILEDGVFECHTELLSMGRRVQSILNEELDFIEKNELPEFLVRDLKHTVAEIDCWILEDMFEPRRTELHTSHGIPDSSIEPFFYLRRHPLFCGMMIFHFSLTLNNDGLFVTNCNGGTICAAHLYNALRHEDFNSQRWMDMEALILIHGNDRIFRHEHAPTNPAQYSRSYERATGTSEMMAERKAQDKTGNYKVITTKNAEKRGIRPASIVCQQYYQRFCNTYRKGLSFQPTLPDMERLLNEITDREMSDMIAGLRILGDGDPQDLPLGSSTSTAITASSSLINPLSEERLSSDHALTQQFQTTHKLTSIQLLNVLCTRVAHESYTLNFNYFSFQRRCLLLTKKISEEFSKDIADMGEFPRPLKFSCGEVPFVAHFVFRLMEDESKRADVVKRLGDIMNALVEKEGNLEVMAVRDYVSGGEKRAVKQIFL